MGILIHPALYSSAITQALVLDIILCIVFLTILILFYSHGTTRKISPDDYFYQHFNITDREKDIIALIIKGANNQEIGKKLFISEKTVKSHVYNIYQKSGIQNRVELINKINEGKEQK